MKIIKISALWCPSCLIMSDIIDEVLNEKNLDIIKYDFDMDADIVENYNVGNILPVIIKVDENGNEIGRIIGEHTKKELIDFLEG